METIKKGMKEWEAGSLKKVLDRSPETREVFETESGIPVNRLYTPLDQEEMDYNRDLGFPGEYPFTRGVYPTMYRGRLWTMRNYAGFGTAEDTNKRFRFLLEQGMVGLSMAFDLPTQLGYDSDDPLSEGAVGRVGVAVDSLADMETIFEGIPLDKVSTSMTINAPATVLLAMYVAVGEKQGVPRNKLMGTTQNDILKEFIARGTYIFPPEPSIKLVLDIVEYCAEHIPRWNTLNIAGYHFREAGANAIQERATASMMFDQMMPETNWTLSSFTILLATCSPTSGLNWSSPKMTSVSRPPTLPCRCSRASSTESFMCLPMMPAGPESVVMKPILSLSAAAAGCAAKAAASSPAAMVRSTMPIIVPLLQLLVMVSTVSRRAEAV